MENIIKFIINKFNLPTNKIPSLIYILAAFDNKFADQLK